MTFSQCVSSLSTCHRAGSLSERKTPEHTGMSAHVKKRGEERKTPGKEQPKRGCALSSNSSAAPILFGEKLGRERGASVHTSRKPWTGPILVGLKRSRSWDKASTGLKAASQRCYFLPSAFTPPVPLPCLAWLEPAGHKGSRLC